MVVFPNRKTVSVPTSKGLFIKAIRSVREATSEKDSQTIPVSIANIDRVVTSKKEGY